MTISGTAAVTCPGCGRAHEVTLHQSINAARDPDLKRRLLAGELNVLACDCGRRTGLAATLLYHDPDRAYFCQACPGGERAMAEGAEAFRSLGGVGTQRLVPSQNALIEKVKLLDAGLDDRVVEVLKVLLLASRQDDINTVLLFDRRDGELVVWFLADLGQTLTSPYAAYEKLATTLKPSDDHAGPFGPSMRIDRAWAVEVARTMLTNAN